MAKILLRIVIQGLWLLSYPFPGYISRKLATFPRTPRRLKKVIPASEFLRRAERSTLTWQGEQLEVFRWRHPKEESSITPQGKTILLVHGWEHNVRFLQAMAEELFHEGFNVLAMNGPAHGNSQRKRTDIFDYGKAFGKLMEEFGPVDAAVAHSFGGSALLLYMGQHQPESKLPLVLIATPMDYAKVTRQFADQLILPDRLYHLLVKGLEAYYQLPIQKMNMHLAEEFAAHNPMLYLQDPDDQVVKRNNGMDAFKHFKNCQVQEVHNVGHNRILNAATTLQKTKYFMVNL